MQCVLVATVLAANTGLVPTADPEALSVDAGRELAYVADKAGLDIIRLDGKPRAVAEVALPSSIGVGHGMLGGDYVVCVCSSYGLAVINVTTPEAPSVLGTMKLYGASRVTLKGNVAYVSARKGGLLLVDLSSPSTPVTLSVFKVPDAYDAYLTGNTAYIANYRLGLVIADISDPHNPVQILEFDSPKFSYVHEVRPVPGKDNMVYVCDEDNGFFVLDTKKMEVVADYSEPVNTVRMVAGENVVYLASFSMGLLQVDTTSILAPKISNTLSGDTIDVAVMGDRFLSLEPSVGLRVFEPAEPTAVPTPAPAPVPTTVPTVPTSAPSASTPTPTGSAPKNDKSSSGQATVYGAVGGSTALLLVILAILVALHRKNRVMVQTVGDDLENLDQPLEGVAFNPEVSMVLEETEVIELAE